MEREMITIYNELVDTPWFEDTTETIIPFNKVVKVNKKYYENSMEVTTVDGNTYVLKFDGHKDSAQYTPELMNKEFMSYLHYISKKRGYFSSKFGGDNVENVMIPFSNVMHIKYNDDNLVIKITTLNNDVFEISFNNEEDYRTNIETYENWLID